MIGKRMALVSGAILALAACAGGAGQQADSAATPVVSVRTALVMTQSFTQTIEAIGTVAPRAGHTASVSAPTAGRVTSVMARVGQSVAAGDALVELDPAPFQGNVESAKAAVDAAQQASDRAQRLATAGIVPRRDAEEATTALARARADYAQATREAQLATLRAPIGGVVTAVNASLGATADPSQGLVEIADPSALDIGFALTPTNAARIHTGARVALTAGEAASGETLGTGTVRDIAGTVDPDTRSVDVLVTMPAARRPLRIGETVLGRIEVRTTPNAIVVPAEALVPDGETFKVFVVDSEEVAHARTVTVAARTATLAEISEGLKPGERVVTYGAYGVDDGVKVVAADSATPPAAEKAP